MCARARACVRACVCVCVCVRCAHQAVAVLGQGDEHLVAGRAHVEADGQQLLQRRHDQRRLHRVVLPPATLVLPLLVAAGLHGDQNVYRKSTYRT